MGCIWTETKSNGYEAQTLQKMIFRFERVAAMLFPGCKVSHFYYGDRLDMVDIVIPSGDYGHFNIYSDRVSLTGYTGKEETIRQFERMTHNDELYDGKLIELSGM